MYYNKLSNYLGNEVLLNIALGHYINFLLRKGIMNKNETLNGEEVDRENVETNSKGKSEIDPSPITPADIIPLTPEEQQEKEKKGTAAGETCAVLFTNTLAAIFGERWEPTPGETVSLKYGFSAFFTDRGIEKIPANVSMIVGTAGYILPRMVAIRKETRERKRAERAKSANLVPSDPPAVDNIPVALQNEEPPAPGNFA